MTRWKLWVLLGAVFLCGLAAGAAGTGFVAKRHMWPPSPGDKDFKPAQVREFMLQRLAHEVGMSKEQTDKTRAIFEGAYPRFEAVRRRIKPELDAILDETTQQMKVFLDQGQQARLDAFVAEVKKREMPPPGPPPGPPPME